MYIRQIKKKRSEKAQTFYQYSLVQNTRIGTRVKQENILYLGSEKLLAEKQNRKAVSLALKAKIYNDQALFPSALPQDLSNLVASYFAKYPESLKRKTPATIQLPPSAHKADFQTVDINSTQISEVKSFGAENLCKQAIKVRRTPESLWLYS